MEAVLILIAAAGHGIAMKIADLLDEHGLRMFKHADMLFGLIYGALGAGLCLSGNEIGSMMLGIHLSFVWRGTLDYPNHRLATALVFFVGILMVDLDVEVFTLSALIWTGGGFLRDSIDKFSYFQSRPTLYKVLDVGPYDLLLACGLYYTTESYLPSLALLAFSWSYSITKEIGERKGYV